MKIAIGTGKRNMGEGWFHIDGARFPHIQSDDIWLGQLPDDSADVIYSSHFLEYFNRQFGLELVKCWHRVLIPGGTIRLAVPDFDAMADALLNKGFKLKDILGPLYGKMMMGNQEIYHKTVYNYEDMVEFLTSAGYKDVRRYDWRETDHANIDDCSRAYLPHDSEAIRTGIFDNHLLISLNVEATK